MKLKKILALTAMAVIGGGSSAFAQIAAGDYFIQNVESGSFLNGANSWGTKASSTKHGQKMTIAASGSGYTIDSHISNGGNNHYVNQGDNLYVDGAAIAHTITSLGDGVYTVQSPNGDYLVQEGNFVNFKNVAVSDATKWRFLSMDDMFKTLDDATADNPVDATFFVGDANFSRNNQYFSQWLGTPAKGGANDNMCAEAYNKSFNVYQSVEGVPAGQYKVYCQGFFRYGFADNAQNNYGKEDTSLFPTLYANTTEAPLQAVLNEETLQAIKEKNITAGSWSDVTINGTAYKIPNNMEAASNCFSAGLYGTSLDVTVGEEGKIVMGFKKTATNNPDGNWTIFDNFEIYFYGVDVEAARAAMTALQAKARAMKDNILCTDAIAANIDAAITASDLSAAPKASEVASKTKALNDAMTQALADMEVEKERRLTNPTDGDNMTFAIVNPGAEDAEGWTMVRDGKAADLGVINNASNAHSGSKLFETAGWGPKAAEMSQTLTGMPNGIYTLTAYFMGANETTAKLSVNGTESESPITGTGAVGDDRWKVVTATGSTINNTLVIKGISNTDTEQNWANFDDFTLTLVHKYTDEELNAFNLNYTINAVDAQGNLIKKINEGSESVNTVVYYPHAIEKDGIWYLSTATTYAATITENNQVVNVTYIADPDIVYYSDGEGGHAKQQTLANPENYSNGNVCNNMASNAANARDRGLSVCNLSAGSYKITARIVKVDKLGREFNLRSGSDIITSVACGAEGEFSANFTIDSDMTNLLINGANTGEAKSLQMQDIDYFYITRIDFTHLEKIVIKDAECDSNNAWAGSGRTTETMVAYDGQNRTVFSSNTYAAPGYKVGQRKQEVTLPYNGTYKLTAFVKIPATTGFVNISVDDLVQKTVNGTEVKSMKTVDTDGVKTETLNSDAQGWVASEMYFDANEGDKKTIYLNISKGNGTNNVDYAYLSGFQLEYAANGLEVSLDESGVNPAIAVNTTASEVSVAKSLKAGKYNTLCVPFSMDKPSGWTVLELSSVSGTEVNFAEATSIVAGKAYLVQVENNEASVNASDVQINTSASVSSANDGYDFVGTMAATKAPVGSYVLQTQNGEQKFYIVAEGSQPTLYPFKAYLAAPAASSKAFSIGFADEGATAAAAINALVEGKAKIYDLNGRELPALQKGVNIVNGVKVIVKY